MLPALRVALVLVASSWIPAAGQEAPPEAPPLFSFAWISDMHLDEGRSGAVAEALRHADELKPDFVLFTGDNNAQPAPENPARPEPVSLRRQRFLKDFLDKHLKSPRVVIPGDNWPGDFDKVFGPMQFSFDYGGVHFLLLAADRSCKARGAEGLSAFDPPTWDWIRKDLEASRGRPVLVAIHEPVHPPAFLDAPPLRALLRRHLHAIAVLQGHLHVDMEWGADGKAYLVGPALGADAAPKFKLVRVHPDRIVLRTLARPLKEDRFEMAGREQRIDIPPALREALKKPAGGFEMGNISAVPPHPHVDDPSLFGRRDELMKIMRGFMTEELLRGRAKKESEVPQEPR